MQLSGMKIAQHMPDSRIDPQNEKIQINQDTISSNVISYDKEVGGTGPHLANLWGGCMGKVHCHHYHQRIQPASSGTCRCLHYPCPSSLLLHPPQLQSTWHTWVPILTILTYLHLPNLCG